MKEMKKKPRFKENKIKNIEKKSKERNNDRILRNKKDWTIYRFTPKNTKREKQ